MGRLELVPSAQAVFDIVTLPFIRRDAHRRIRNALSSLPGFQGLSLLEMEFVVRIAEDKKVNAGKTLVVSGLCVILEGSMQVSDRSLGSGEFFWRAPAPRR